MNNPIIKIKNIFKRYDVKPKSIDVLKDVNVEISQGEFAMIFGPSGSGKSTLLNVLLGLEDATKGSINFAGVDITNANSEELANFRKKNVGIIYQQPYWIKSLNVQENVAFPLVLRGYSKIDANTKALKMLEQFELSEWATFLPSELSSGQQQKVSLARALITDPQIIVADEPTGNLDYKSGKELSEYLQKLSIEGKTVIMVTHNIDNLDFAKRFLYIFDGKIVRDSVITKDNIKEIKESLITENKVDDGTAVPYKADLSNLSNPKRKREQNSGFFKNIFTTIGLVILSTILVIVSLTYRILHKVFSISVIFKPLDKLITGIYDKFIDILDKSKIQSISYIDIFELSFKNLFAKRNRALITIGGVALGIGFTAFLVSIGFGIENLVISQVAELEQLKQIDVYPSLGESVIINEDALGTLKGLDHVEQTYPVISIAGNVNYQDSNADVVVYGVQSAYLNTIESKITTGNLFEDNPISGNEGIVVNQSFLDVIGLNSGNAINKTLKISYILTDSAQKTDKTSEPKSFDYTIVGVISSNDAPKAYAPIQDVQSLGIKNYSQVRLVTSDQTDVDTLRQQLNVLGFRTTAILDTVQQIQGFFDNARVVFAIVGFVALFVAALGMFNTLTVSLLERTKEVGLMKAIGMRAEEVKHLFLSESITMGLLGGIVGILFGVIAGNLLSFIISLISISRGYGYLNLVNLPISSAVIILLISGITGVLTGLYPATRATKISALDALRYE